MQISKIYSLRTSIYDKSGMICVNPTSKDFAASEKGSRLKNKKNGSSISENSELDFETELKRAQNLIENGIDS